MGFNSVFKGLMDSDTVVLP